MSDLDLDLQTIRALLRNSQADPEAAPEAAQPESSTAPDQSEVENIPEKPALSLRRRRLSRLVLPTADPPKTDTSATDNLFTLSPTVYVPPPSPIQASASGESSLTLQPTVYEGSSITLSPTCYQAPPRSEFGPLRAINRNQHPPLHEKASRQSLYNPAADRVPGTHLKPSPVILNKDGKRTEPPWKSPNFPDLTCGHKTVIPQAFFEQEERLIKRLETAKAQEQSGKEPETVSKRLSTIEEKEENLEEKGEAFEGREDASKAEKERAEDQIEIFDAQEETSIQPLTSTEAAEEGKSPEEKLDSPEEGDEKPSPEEEEENESPEEEEEKESPEEKGKEKEESSEEEEEEDEGSSEEEEDEPSPKDGGEDLSPQEEEGPSPPKEEERKPSEKEDGSREEKYTSPAQKEGTQEQVESSGVHEQTLEDHPITSGTSENMPGGTKIPQPGPAKLGKNSDLDQWLECAKKCQYLPEAIMKKLCEMVKELLMEESNVQPVSTPVTICGDIHGQFYDLLELFRVGGGMPDDTQIDAPTVATRIITSDDIEPPTEITDPKLKRKMKKSLSSSSSGDSSNLSSELSDDDDDEEGRGRSRGIEAELGMKKGNQEGLPGSQNYIFLGDFVDRGYFSLETFTLLMCLKAKFPDRITLVRGNHESRQITQVYGFYEECQQKYGNASVWKACCQVFDFLILAAVIDGKVLCVHGGLSPEIRTLDQIRVVARAQEIPHEGAFCDLVWSDPEEVETWAVSPRGAGWLFGDKVASEFNHVNGLQLIARAHQLVNEGFKWHFRDKSVVTVWSAPNYCYRCGNIASIMNLGEDLNPKFTIFSAVPDDQRAVPGATGRRADYFL